MGITYAAAKTNNVQLFRWLEAHGYDSNDNCLCVAIARGHEEMLTFLLQEGYPIETHMLQNIGHTNGERMLQMLEGYGPVDLRRVCINALHGSCMEFLEKIASQIKLDSRLYRHALLSGRLEMVQWCQNKGLALEENYIPWAVMSDNVEMVEFLRAQGQEWVPELHIIAAKRGKEKMLKYLCKFYPLHYWQEKPLQNHVVVPSCVNEALWQQKRERWLRLYKK